MNSLSSAWHLAFLVLLSLPGAAASQQSVVFDLEALDAGPDYTKKASELHVYDMHCLLSTWVRLT